MRALKMYAVRCAAGLAGLLLTATSAWAQEVKVQAQLENEKILIGDQVKLDLRVEHPPGIRLKWPVTDSIGKLEIIERKKADTLSKAGESIVKERITYLVTSFDTGFYPIPPFRVAYSREGDTATLFAESQAMLLSVYAPKIDTTQAIKDIKSPLEEPYTLREALPYIAGLAGLIGLAVLVYYLLKKRRKGEKVFVPPAPKRPAHELALEQLRQLEEEKIWQQGNYKLYHSRLSDIVREYIEARYGLRAMELTTEEILSHFRTLPATNEQKEQLAYLLKLSDLVKFARMQPLPAENEMSMRNACSFVQTSAPAALSENPAAEPKTNGV
jgi:hypothetical protein